MNEDVFNDMESYEDRSVRGYTLGEIMKQAYEQGYPISLCSSL